MHMRDKIAVLERECRELREAVDKAVANVARHESGEELSRMREQRDLLWLFARQCFRWSHTCQCGYQALNAIKAAGLGGHDEDKRVAEIEPHLALRLELRR